MAQGVNQFLSLYCKNHTKRWKYFLQRQRPGERHRDRVRRRKKDEMETNVEVSLKLHVTGSTLFLYLLLRLAFCPYVPWVCVCVTEGTLVFYLKAPRLFPWDHFWSDQVVTKRHTHIQTHLTINYSKGWIAILLHETACDHALKCQFRRCFPYIFLHHVLCVTVT